MGCTKEMSKRLDAAEETVESLRKKLRQVKRNRLHKYHDVRYLAELAIHLRQADEVLDEIVERSNLRHKASGQNETEN